MAPPEKPKNEGPPVTIDENGPSRAIDRHHEIFFAAVETTRMPMIVTDPHRPDNPIIFANRAFEKMTGYHRSEILGSNCRLLQGPETDAGTIADVRRFVVSAVSRAGDDVRIDLSPTRQR